jgi:hypothetical protein
MPGASSCGPRVSHAWEAPARVADRARQVRLWPRANSGRARAWLLTPAGPACSSARGSQGYWSRWWTRAW